MRLTQDSTLAYILTFGNFGKFSDGYSHSIVLDVAVTSDLNYVFQSDLLEAGDSESYGINQYLLYDINEWLAVGTRAEWWKSDGTSYYGITGGFNIRPTGNFVVRPEVRYQYSPAGKTTSGIFSPENPAGLPVNEGAVFGIDAILTF